MSATDATPPGAGIISNITTGNPASKSVSHRLARSRPRDNLASLCRPDRVGHRSTPPRPHELQGRALSQWHDRANNCEEILVRVGDRATDLLTSLRFDREASQLSFRVRRPCKSCSVDQHLGRRHAWSVKGGLEGFNPRGPVVGPGTVVGRYPAVVRPLPSLISMSSPRSASRR